MVQCSYRSSMTSPRARSLEPEAFALRYSPLQQPLQLLRIRVLGKHQNVEARVRRGQVIRVWPRSLNLKRIFRRAVKTRGKEMRKKKGMGKQATGQASQDRVT